MHGVLLAYAMMTPASEMGDSFCIWLDTDTDGVDRVDDSGEMEGCGFTMMAPMCPFREFECLARMQQYVR